MRGLILLLAAITIVSVTFYEANRPVPFCKIINGREIDNHRCIPYCPPDPRECD